MDQETGSVTSARPVIGISAYAEAARWGIWDVPAILLPRRYVDAVSAAGGVPVLVPPLPDVVRHVMSRLDGLIIAGGPDVDPARYGEERGEHTAEPRTDRDAAELALVRAATDGAVPLLGVCRGMQLLNVSRGGTLVQHLPDVVGHEGHAPQPGVYGRHVVRVETGTCTAAALGAQRLEVPTYHHQGIGRLGRRLTPTAWSEDGTIEAMEDPSLPFCLGVQWHPEAGEDLRIFASLVAAARRRGR